MVGLGLGLRSRRLGYTPVDADATAFIAGVESADGQPISNILRAAIDAFYIGTKADASPNAGVSNYQATTQFFLPFVAKTLAGSLVPAKGLNPINVGLVSGNFIPKKGWAETVLGQAIRSGYLGTAFAQNNSSAWGWQTRVPRDNNGVILADNLAATGTTNLFSRGTLNDTAARSQSSTSNTISTVFSGFTGISRNSSASYTLRRQGVNTSFAVTSQAPSNLERHYLSDPGFLLSYTGELGATGQGAAITLSSMESRIATLAAAVALQDANPTFALSNTTTLFVIAGQSNAGGFGPLTKANFPHTFSRVQTYRKANHLSTANDGAFELLNFGANNSVTGSQEVQDPGTFIAKLLERLTGNDIRMVDMGVGSTTFWTGHWVSGGSLREALINHYLAPAIAKLKAEGRNVRVLPVFWVFGEGDSQQESYANAYLGHAESLYADLRAVVPNVPIIAAKANVNINNTGLLPFVATVRAAQETQAASDSRNYLINADDLPLQDYVHYSYQGFMGLAARYVELAATIGSVEA